MDTIGKFRFSRALMGNSSAISSLLFSMDKSSSFILSNVSGTESGMLTP